jgi:sulfur relay (sulfurtransferase) DsrC/TusE family protein
MFWTIIKVDDFIISSWWTWLRFILSYSKWSTSLRKKEISTTKSSKKIKQFWESNERVYVTQQFIKMLRNIRKIVFKKWIIHDAMKTLIKIINYRLSHSERKMRIENSLTNDDWAKVIVEKFISSRLIISTSIMTIISSTSVREEKKKNRRIFLLVFFFSNLILSSIEAKKKNREIILVDFFLKISSISSYSLLIVSFFFWLDF